jgi:hypothetical protein
MSLEREQKHLPILISVCFVGNFLLGGLGELFAPNSFGQVFSWQWGSLLFMAGGSLFAAKLATEKWHISSAGFILLCIGQGIFYTMQNKLPADASTSDFATGIMVFLPGMLFLTYYSGFPVWLRIYNVIAVLPFLFVMIKIDMMNYVEAKDMPYNIAGFAMTQVAGIFWSYFAIRPYGKLRIQPKD